MKTTNVAIVNGISLQVVSDDREQLVAVKPVCEILGVAYQSQQAKLKEHPIYSSVITLSVTTGSDGKKYEMVCIPLQFFPGWLFSINPDNVKEEAREQLIKYQLECNKVLFDYFFGRAEFAQKKEQEFSRQMEVVATAKKNFRDAKLVLNEAELKLRQINAMTFEEWQANERQLTIPGFE
ncbi:phage antirepressor N-terminal domain-containing protein [Prevotella sp. tf2-5]|uniref:phage antirepressor N-terminal domain-containing protein n=1 Tax=Prevotella sp. tf2-5 TaxID=1761889 RepID=UPI0008E76781|nr:phage antirepressor N-terminal domain-containing protein [Prevotella sp. tf2-5]SFO62356.1 P22_AR N-terminal domain-containing protein [Prevotella sp. tf2-5]